MINEFYSFCEDNDYIQEKQGKLPESHNNPYGRIKNCFILSPAGFYC